MLHARQNAAELGCSFHAWHASLTLPQPGACWMLQLPLAWPRLLSLETHGGKRISHRSQLTPIALQRQVWRVQCPPGHHRCSHGPHASFASVGHALRLQLQPRRTCSSRAPAWPQQPCHYGPHWQASCGTHRAQAPPWAPSSSASSSSVAAAVRHRAGTGSSQWATCATGRQFTCDCSQRYADAMHQLSAETRHWCLYGAPQLEVARVGCSERSGSGCRVPTWVPESMAQACSHAKGRLLPNPQPNYH